MPNAEAQTNTHNKKDNSLQNTHPDLCKEWDYDKNEKLSLTPGTVSAGSGKKVWWKCAKCGQSWMATIANRARGSGCPVCAGKKVVKGINDLSTTFPDLCKEWDYTKNKALGLTPETVTGFANKSVWWKCSTCGQSWMTSIANRARGSGCPYCSGNTPTIGVNDLLSTHPDLCKEWDYTKNVIKPTEVTAGSTKKVWWICDKKHSWESSILNRSKGSNCPYCYGKRVVAGVNDLATTHPELCKEWDYDKNKETPETVSAGSSKKVWWKCPICGRNWAATIANRTRGSRCPHCSRIGVVVGENDLATTHPDLCKEWDNEKNAQQGVYPQAIKANSRGKIWWRCHKGHSYQETIGKHLEGNDCPVCKGKIVVPGTNDLLTTHPELCKEWDYTKNDLNPSEITAKSTKKVWWQCSRGHNWKATIQSRAKGVGCPVCEGEKAIPGVNDLATTHPKLCKEWDYTKNDLNPSEITAKCKQKIWWVCPEGHSWSAPIRNRIIRPACPLCAVKGKSLAITHPQLIKEWDYNKNTITPEEVTHGSQTKVWWKCSACGYEWKTTIESRTRGTGCPICTSMKTSFPEQAVLYYVRQAFPDVISGDKSYGFELDIYIPSIKAAIEYDGLYYHSGRKKLSLDNKKDSKCSSLGIILIRLREEGLPPTEKAINLFRKENRSNEDLDKCILSILRILGGDKSVTPDVDRDFFEIHKQYTESFKKNSLAEKYPDIAGEWDYEKNAPLTPKQVLAHSGQRFWWKCSKCGNSWKTDINSRTKGSGCPYCVGLRTSTGVNDLLTTHPDLCKEWDYEKNRELGLSPDNVSAGSTKKVWWKCDKGHSWCAVIKNRTKGSGCPYCSGNKVWPGFNDLLTLHPDLCKEWDYTKNEIDPSQVTAGSNKKVWWKCSKCGHEWAATIGSRTSGAGCPGCDRKKRNASRRKDGKFS